MELNLVVDSIVKGKIYPSLAQYYARPYTAGWREFGSHFPYTIPIRLQEYCDQHGVAIHTYNIQDLLPDVVYYPIGLSFFDFNIDYFSLLPADVIAAVRQKKLRVLFYYHEGDNPERIKHRLDYLATQSGLDYTCYVFISGNTAANNIPGFVYFNDFEFWYYQRNYKQTALEIHTQPRERDFTVLNRLHKPWRAAVMADMRRTGLLDNSYWSYCESGEFVDSECPIEIDTIPGLRTSTQEFLRTAPYLADDLTQSQRNDHSVTDAKFHTQSYCNIVVETHFDADQSGGAFITEKTFKAIKHGQLFMIAGCANSLKLLRELGYRTFDNVFDTSYDSIENPTQRWCSLRNSMAQAKPRLKDCFLAAQEDITHNQQLFAANKAARLNRLFEEINEQHR